MSCSACWPILVVFLCCFVSDWKLIRDLQGSKDLRCSSVRPYW